MKFIMVSLFMVIGLMGCGNGSTDRSGKTPNQPAVTPPADQTSRSLNLKGSDTMVNLGQAWAEAFMKKHPGVTVSVTGGGSGTGIAALINGTCDLVQSSRAMKEKEKRLAEKNGRQPQEYIVGLDGLAVVVHPFNPVKEMTIDQLADIFTGKIKSWQEVGGPALGIVLLSREVNSGTHVYFKEHILRKGNEKGSEEFAASALLMPSSQAIADEISQNKAAIGYYGLGYVGPKQKQLAVAQKGGSYILPTPESVSKGSYPISRPLFFYAAAKPTGRVAAFLDFVLSTEGQAIVKQLDFVPVK